jgi:hypothetical protein
MWSALATRATHRIWIPNRLVDLLLAMGTLYERSPTLSDYPHCCANIGDYSAHNSWRAYSIFSRKVRSRDICRCTLSTLWITVE